MKKSKNNKNKKRNLLYLSFIIAIIIIMIIIIIVVNKGKKEKNNDPKQIDEYVSQFSNGTKTNTSSNLHENKEFEGLQISDINLTQNNNTNTSLTATITNISDTVQGGYSLYIKILDKSEEELIRIPIFVPELYPGDSTPISSTISYNLINAYNISFEK